MTGNAVVPSNGDASATPWYALAPNVGTSDHGQAGDHELAPTRSASEPASNSTVFFHAPSGVPPVLVGSRASRLYRPAGSPDAEALALLNAIGLQTFET